MGIPLTEAMENILTALMGNVLTELVGKVLDIYIDPLPCPQCGGTMKVIAF